MKHLHSLVLFTVLLLTFQLWAQEIERKSAHEIWTEMTEAGITQHQRRTYVAGAPGVEQAEAAADAGKYVMFGGEKEGSSALITRVMGPDKASFKTYVERLPEEQRAKFLREFLDGWSSGRYRLNGVKNAAGELVQVDLTGLKGVNYQSLSATDLDAKFDLFLERTGDTSFSHIKKQTRMNIFNGKFEGLSQLGSMKKALKDYTIHYGQFVPLLGEPEKFIEAAHNTSTGWEMNFKPQKSYGEFENMIDWFRTTLKNVGEKFEAPGHQWIVFPKTAEAIKDPAKATELVEKVGEIHKNNQAYIVLKGIEGNAGIEMSNYKAVHHDETLVSGQWSEHSTGRGVIRLENERFAVDGAQSYAIEFRAGTKSDPIRRKTQKFLISRYAAQEFDDLAPGKSWELQPGMNMAPEDIVRRFGVTPAEAEGFLNKLDTSTYQGRWGEASVSAEYRVPLWNWEDAPYLTDVKKAEIKRLTATYIKSVASLPSADLDAVRLAMRDWAITSRISHDIENYLRPKPQIDMAKAHVYPVKPGAAVDVNKIDFGIEYSARYPLKTSADYVPVPGQAGKYEWRKTYYDYTPEERERVIKGFAQQLGKEMNNGRFVPVEKIVSDGHGHGLDIAYEVKDSQGRTWRAEWDGIGRSYDLNGGMIDTSVRGGHVEIVTPKFTPNEEDMKRVFKAMEKQSLLPQQRFGGGHVNVDLKEFQGKPKAMARFIATYLENRNIMSIMFQHPGRQMGAEPIKVSQNFLEKLKNFNGTEEELKQLLYNEKFFNTRVGRKTKNTQLNLLAYLQDVIPEQFLHEDFDMKNDTWRRTFDVEPKIRKMEFRMFNAPRNAAESALQIKFVKALMNKALNENGAVLASTNPASYKVDYETYARDPEKALKDFDKTMRDLGLDPKEYRAFLVEGLEVTKAQVESPRYLPMSERYKNHPEVRDWGRAVPARATPIASQGRKWNGSDVIPEAEAYREAQMVARRAAENARQTSDPRGKVYRPVQPVSINTGAHCRTPADTLADLLNDAG